MKKTLALALIMGYALTSLAQKPDSSKTTTIKLRGTPIAGTAQPLIVIDGNKQYTRDINLLALAPDNIESINILKDSSAVSAYGVDGFAGVIEIKTKGVNPIGNSKIVTDSNSNLNLKGKISGLSIRPSGKIKGSGSITNMGIKLKNNNASPLYIIDGKETTDSLTIDQDNIKSIEVLKDASAKKLYGNKASNGVVIITTKNAKPLSKKN